MTHMQTRAVHAGREDLAELGVHALPIDLSTTYPIHDLDVAISSFDAWISGASDAPNPIYARMHNPTVARFEKALADLEGTTDAVAFASGMAATSACLLAARQQGSHVLGVRPLYGTNDHVLDEGLVGPPVRWVEANAIASEVRDDTALIFIETPGNPTLNLIDIRAVVEAAGSVPVLVDSTFATPALQQPAKFGATLVMHSATKFIGGHGDVIAGVVACNATWGKLLRKVRAATGGLLHPLAAYLLHRGLSTLAMRVEKAQDNAKVLAQRLAEHPAVNKTYYPGLGTVTNAHLLGTQMHGPGTMISFDLKGGHAAAASLMRNVKVATPAVSLGSVDTLIQHPAGLTHRMVDEATRARYGITPGLIRLSVGVEHVEDLWEDLAQAMAADET